MNSRPEFSWPDNPFTLPTVPFCESLRVRLGPLLLFLAMLALATACDSSGVVGMQSGSAGDDSSEQDTGNNGDAAGDQAAGDSPGNEAGDSGGSEDSEIVPIQDPGPFEGLLGLRLDPPGADLQDDGQAPGETLRFKALGMFDNGERDISTQVQWSLDTPNLGTVAGGLFESASIGGRALVKATAGDREALATLTVKLNAVVVAAGLPEEVASMFPENTSADLDDPERAPLIVYPSHETMFPRNLERVLHQWRADGSLDLFELRFDSPVAKLRFYTSERSLLPDGDAWRWLAESHPGEAVEVTVRGLAASDPELVYGSQPVTVLYSSSEVLGALYYWSTGAQGVMRATLSSGTASKFYPEPGAENEDTCVSCHTVSRDGRRMSVGYDGEHLQQLSVPDRALQIPATTDPMNPPALTESGPDYGWGTFNPGATRLLYAHKGALTLLDAATGDPISELTLPEWAYATHPDWSPDNSHVAVSYIADGDAPGNKHVQGTGLARIPVLPDGSFGAPEVLIESTDGWEDTISFPSYSPDGRYIAFVRSEGKSKDNPQSVLWLIRADGSSEPVALTRLNERVQHLDGVVDIGNAMPTWAPSTRPDEVFWIAFSSLRDYGEVLVDEERDQLWGVAVDPTRIEVGQDPSYAAFWMPFQQLEEGNHRAFWALDTEQECPTDIEICDGLDNDCDGIIDNDCCTFDPPELCDDMLDNDCDGQVNEGCGCSEEEICGNGIDDDCDMAKDDEDEDCFLSIPI